MALVLIHPSIGKASVKKKKEDLPIEDSTFLMAATYDPEMAQMTITMKNGGEYTYSSIDPSTFERFKQARDKSRFYANEIRGVEKGSRTVNKTIGKAIQKVSKTKRS